MQGFSNSARPPGPGYPVPGPPMSGPHVRYDTPVGPGTVPKISGTYFEVKTLPSAGGSSCLLDTVNRVELAWISSFFLRSFQKQTHFLESFYASLSSHAFWYVSTKNDKKCNVHNAVFKAQSACRGKWVNCATLSIDRIHSFAMWTFDLI